MYDGGNTPACNRSFLINYSLIFNSQHFMKYSLLIFPLLFSTLAGLTQDLTNTGNLNKYIDSLKAFRENYIDTHDVVKTEEDKKLLAFFPIDPSYQVKCRFEKIDKADWFPMNSSGSVKRPHRRYGKLTSRVSAPKPV